MHVINLFTIRHSGTITFRNFLMQFVQHEVPLEVLAGNQYLLEYPNNRGLSRDRKNLVWGHIQKKNLEISKALSWNFPTIITLRDPLRSIITSKKRNPNNICTHILQDWVYLLKELEPNHPYYVPIDLYSEFEDRARAIEGLVEYAELYWVDKWGNLVENFADKWPEENSQGAYPLKLAYYNKDTKYIQKELPKEWEALTLMEPIIRGFLEEHGYKELIWYS